MRLSAQTVALCFTGQKTRKLVLSIRQQCDLFCMLARQARLNAEKNRCDISNWENTDSTGQETKKQTIQLFREKEESQ